MYTVRCVYLPIVTAMYYGPVILTKFLKIAMLHIVLDWQMIYKTVFVKAFFVFFWRFYLFLVFVSKNFTIGPSESGDISCQVRGVQELSGGDGDRICHMCVGTAAVR